jgi:hypothetical protein
MSVTHIPATVRRQVVADAKGACEYCKIHEYDTFFGCQVDHIIAEKHGGETVLSNLALACAVCNRAKGSDIATLVDGELVRLFHPKQDHWHEHFEFSVDHHLLAKTKIGQATIQLLRFNDPDRILERSVLARVGRYPFPKPPSA